MALSSVNLNKSLSVYFTRSGSHDMIFHSTNDNNFNNYGKYTAVNKRYNFSFSNIETAAVENLSFSIV